MPITIDPKPKRYVCVCNAITDSTIRKAIKDGAKTLGEVADRCGDAGRDCGLCQKLIQKMIDNGGQKKPKL
jgi:bacterioferritin-associated ferredoxin